jgi:hypothetical protein
VTRLHLALFGIIAALATGPALAGGDLPPEDMKTLRSYTLSMDKVNAMSAAAEESRKIVDDLRAQGRSPDKDAQSLAEMETKLKAVAPLYAIYQKHGLTAEDAVVMPFVLLFSGMIVQYPSAAASLAEETSPEQIAFYKAHEKELKAMTWLNGSASKAH